MHASSLSVAPLAAALASLLASPAVFAQAGSAPAAVASAVAADSAEDQRTPTDLDAVQVEAERLRKASSPRYTEELVDTPQSITVITRETMDQQNLLGLQDVLSTLPGITFGAGEGGGGYGDKINLRGFDATSDITVDGVRDSGLYTRSDIFNVEAIELVNGANSTHSGAGSVGGNINLVSKAAREGDFHTFTFGAGTDEYGRVTADSNFDLDNGTAVRLNAMGHTQDIAGRDHEFEHRWGFAPSVAFGLGSDTRLTLGYVHQEDRNLPQYGVPFALNQFNDGSLPGIDPETYFGYRNTSRQEVTQDMLTGVFEMDFSDALSWRTLARLQQVDQMSSVSALQGTWCRLDGIDPFTGEDCATLADGSVQPPGTWSPTGGPRGYVRDTRNTIAYAQSDLTASFSTGAVEHGLVAGVALSNEQLELDVGNIFRNADGSALPNDNTTYPLQTFDNPYNIWTGPVNYFRTGRTEGELSSQALYVFDTLHFGERWLLNLGARYDHVEGSTKVFTVDDTGGITGTSGVFKNQDDLFSWRAGVVFKPTQNGSVYLAYSNSETPSKASVNGSCAPSGGNTVDTCGLDPESARNLELGTKWDVLDGRLALTGALFRNERDHYRVATGDPLQPFSLDGEARVTGAMLGAAGRISRNWSLFANYTYLDSEIVQNLSDGNAGEDELAGRYLAQTPKHSGSVWTTYALSDWTFGYGLTYQGEIYPQNNAETVYRATDDYWVHRAMLGYRVNEVLSLQLNVDNLLDEEYYTNIRNNTTSGWAIPGDGRSAQLTATLRF
jgi:catecholate siderophore receptor